MTSNVGGTPSKDPIGSYTSSDNGDKTIIRGGWESIKDQTFNDGTKWIRPSRGSYTDRQGLEIEINKITGDIKITTIFQTAKQQIDELRERAENAGIIGKFRQPKKKEEFQIIQNETIYSKTKPAKADKDVGERTEFKLKGNIDPEFLVKTVKEWCFSAETPRIDELKANINHLMKPLLFKSILKPSEEITTKTDKTSPEIKLNLIKLQLDEAKRILEEIIQTTIRNPPPRSSNSGERGSTEILKDQEKPEINAELYDALELDTILLNDTENQETAQESDEMILQSRAEKTRLVLLELEKTTPRPDSKPKEVDKWIEKAQQTIDDIDSYASMIELRQKISLTPNEIIHPDLFKTAHNTIVTAKQLLDEYGDTVEKLQTALDFVEEALTKKNPDFSEEENAAIKELRTGQKTHLENLLESANFFIEGEVKLPSPKKLQKIEKWIEHSESLLNEIKDHGVRFQDPL